MSDHLAAAWEAAPAFGLVPERIELLSHSENVVYDVTLADGQHVVMRLHRPGYNTLDELDSEVQWVTALGEAGIPVPTAVPATDGGFYTTVEVAQRPHHVGVVEWVDGAPLGEPTSAGGADVAAHYHRIGQLSALIRLHNATWQRPQGFTRRRWDADGFLGEAPLWGRFWEVEALSTDQRAVFVEARTVLFKKLSSLPTTAEYFGLIHADLHLGNLMASNGELTVIDFDDAGFGWFAHELAVSLHPLLGEPCFDDARQALVDGYRTEYPMGAEEEGWIDTFLTVRSLMLVGWLDARRELPAYALFEGLAAEAESMARRYLASA